MSEYLVFAGVALLEPHPGSGPIVAEDLTPLRNFARRGENRVLPGAPGRSSLPHLRDELNVTITWEVKGMRLHTGDPAPDPVVGVETNLEFYRSLFFDDGDAQTEHPVELHEYAGSTFAGALQVIDYAGVRTGPMTGTILTLFRIASGELTEVP